MALPMNSYNAFLNETELNGSGSANSDGNNDFYGEFEPNMQVGYSYQYANMHMQSIFKGCKYVNFYEKRELFFLFLLKT